MREGTDRCRGNRAGKLAFLHVTHNLKNTKNLFADLLNFVENEVKENEISQTHYKDIKKLCATNAHLIAQLQKLLITGDGKQPRRTDAIRQTSADHCAPPDDHEFRQKIVNLMILSLQCWELGTQKGKIELAEASRIWRIHVDGGRLRVRSMDRYLGLRRLPKFPRWHDVVRTAYFVLNTVKSDSSIKQELETSLDKLLCTVRSRSLQADE
jgi:hypothetical protein